MSSKTTSKTATITHSPNSGPAAAMQKQSMTPDQVGPSPPRSGSRMLRNQLPICRACGIYNGARSTQGQRVCSNRVHWCRYRAVMPPRPREAGAPLKGTVQAPIRNKCRGGPCVVRVVREHLGAFSHDKESESYSDRKSNLPVPVCSNFNTDLQHRVVCSMHGCELKPEHIRAPCF